MRLSALIVVSVPAWTEPLTAEERGELEARLRSEMMFWFDDVVNSGHPKAEGLHAETMLLETDNDGRTIGQEIRFATDAPRVKVTR